MKVNIKASTDDRSSRIVSKSSNSHIKIDLQYKNTYIGEITLSAITDEAGNDKGYRVVFIPGTGIDWDRYLIAEEEQP